MSTILDDLRTLVLIIARIIVVVTVLAMLGGAAVSLIGTVGELVTQ